MKQVGDWTRISSPFHGMWCPHALVGNGNMETQPKKASKTKAKPCVVEVSNNNQHLRFQTHATPTLT